MHYAELINNDLPFYILVKVKGYPDPINEPSTTSDINAAKEECRRRLSTGEYNQCYVVDKKTGAIIE